MSPQPQATAQADALMREAFAQHRAGDLAGAEALYRRILAVDPAYADAHYLLGTLERDRGETQLALQHIRRAIAGRREEPTFHYALGELFLAERCWDEAAGYLANAVELDPSLHEAWNGLGCAHYEMHDAERAVPCLEKALALAPDLPQALYNGGRALRDLGRVDEAVAWLQRARTLAPDHPGVFSNYLFTLNLSARHSREDIAAEHFAYGAAFGPAVPERPRRACGARLRVGYFSPDLRRHPVSCFVEPVLRHHDRARFEVTCFHLHPDEDAVSERLRAHCDHWVNGAALTDDELVAAVDAAQIDVLVDLAGHTGWNRLPVLARKPAPVIATWLGYLNTTGLRAVDYRITDVVSDPPGLTESLHTETLVRLVPGHSCFDAPDEAPAVTALPALAAGGIRFGSFNKSSKINEPTVSLWGQLLREVPDSTLLLVGLEPSQEAVVTGQLQNAGVAAGRIECIGRAPLGRMLELHASVDIALDSHPYSGTTTTFNSLWMGVPVVTLAGRSAISRSSASILSALSLGDWVADSPAGYVRLAVAHARDVPALAQLRAGLRRRLQDSALMDGPGFTRQLERAYLDMWENTDQRQRAHAREEKT